MSLPAKVLATCRRLHMFSPGDQVLVAVSGGPDSVALLAALHELAPQLAITLAIAHLDHGIRGPDAAAGDAALVRDLAVRFGLACHFGVANARERAASHGISLEVAARQARYAFLRETAASGGYSHIATGHNLDDQAETVLLALVRGTGLGGLGGIRPAVAGLVRPLIEVSRAEILDFLAAAGIGFRIDETNADLSYPRNRVRHCLLPLLEQEFNPSIRATLARSAQVVQDEDRFISGHADGLYAACVDRSVPGVLALDREAIRAAPVALARRVLRRAIMAIGASQLDGEADVSQVPVPQPGSVHIDDLLILLAEGRTGAVVDLPGKVWAELGYQRLYLRSGRRSPDGDAPAGPDDQIWQLPLSGSLVIAANGWSLAASRDPGPAAGATGDFAWSTRQTKDRLEFTAHLALDKLALPLCVRRRRAGDRIRPHGAPGQRKLQDLLVDAKVPRRLRDQLPVVCDAGGRVVAVLPVRAGELAVVRPETTMVLVLRGSLCLSAPAPLLDPAPPAW
jgi:tRNA(Ile)-lysidine synthase